MKTLALAAALLAAPLTASAGPLGDTPYKLTLGEWVELQYKITAPMKLSEDCANGFRVLVFYAGKDTFAINIQLLKGGLSQEQLEIVEQLTKKTVEDTAEPYGLKRLTFATKVFQPKQSDLDWCKLLAQRRE